MVVGVCRVQILIAGSESQNERRSLVRRVKDKVQARLHLFVADVGDQDLWQSADLAVAVVSRDRAQCERLIDSVLEIVEAEAKVVHEDRDFVDYGDDMTLSGEVTHWEPNQPGPPRYGARSLGDRPSGGGRPPIPVGSRLRSRSRPGSGRSR